MGYRGQHSALFWPRNVAVARRDVIRRLGEMGRGRGAVRAPAPADPVPVGDLALQPNQRAATDADRAGAVSASEAGRLRFARSKGSAGSGSDADLSAEASQRWPRMGRAVSWVFAGMSCSICRLVNKGLTGQCGGDLGWSRHRQGKIEAETGLQDCCGV